MLQATTSSADSTPPVSALSPFRFPVFRSIWFASVASNLGGLIQTVGAAWMMTSIAKSADMVALVQTSVALPIVLLSLFAGAMADNLDRRKVMLGAQIFMLGVSIMLTVCAWQGLITPWLLLMFTFLIGCGAAFNGPAWQASVGDMVPRAHLAGAVAINSMGFNIARSVGPAIGGAIVAAAGAAAAFAVNAASYIALITVLSRWRPVRPPQLLPRETLGIAVAAGIRYVAMSPSIRRVLLRGCVFGIGASSVMALLPLVAKDLLTGGPLTYGLLLGAFGFGAVLGALSSARLRQRLSSEGLTRISCVAFAIAAAIAGISTFSTLTVAMMMIAGASWVLTLSTFNVSVQLSTPRWVVARALSLYQVTTFGGMAAGSWLWGVISESDGVSLALFAAALVMLICAAIGLRVPLSETADLNLDPLRRWEAPDTAVPVESRTGPVVITVEYRIREEDVLEFLAVMAERRRIRKRDGAMHWMLLRDLADASVWVERYTTPTWLEYIRHNNRITQDDATIPERLHGLHQGPGLPIVRRMIERQTGALPAGHVSTPHDLAEPLTDPSRAS
ncbi:MFS transporter [Peristeroidobacter soli]|uniref:MFS transporter n=1 Tax=Peristeroidobacter soli TaxID=2497877 RepID=UPI00101B907F|nr:MFS transporter [Peristeroidobacter soli]